MALRQPIQQCLRAHFTLPTISLCRTFTTTAPALSRAPHPHIKKRRRDPYAREQARAKRVANLSRQEVLKKERAEQLGDPIRGVETEFTRSFDAPPSVSPDVEGSDGHLNFFVHKSELTDGIEKSKWMLTPQTETTDGIEVPPTEQQAKMNEEREKDYDIATEAMNRINALSLGSSKDRFRVNVQRCIDTFGRHSTDQTLPPRTRSTADTSSDVPHERLRAGPDTGSSEVQIAILTAKIRALTPFLQGRGKQDKHNRRNLTLLVHRRQKLLKYLQRKERGGPRWQNIIQTLGLTDGTWKGEITLPRYV